MQSFPNLRRWLLAGISVAVFAGLMAVVTQSVRSPSVLSQAQADQTKSELARVWPLFGGSVSRNMVNTFEKNVPTDWSVEEGKQKHVKWVAPLGTRSYGGPAIADGKIYIGTNRAAPRTPPVPGDKGVVRCISEADGKFLWQSIHDKLPSGLVNDWPDQGICSTPVIDGNRIYYVSNRCELICATTAGLGAGQNVGVQDEKYKGPTDADIVWRLDMLKELNVFPHNLSTSSPLVAGDLVFVITSNGVDEGHINIPSPKAPSFIAVDKKTGKLKWQNNDPGEKILHGQWSNPVYAVVNGKPQVIFPGGDGWMRGFDPQTGNIIWKFDCNPKKSVWKLQGKGTRNNIISTPVVYDNKVYVGVGQDPEHRYGVGHFWCIDITKTGDLSPVNDNFDPKAPVNKDSGLVWHYGGMLMPKPADAERDYVFGRTLSTVAVHDGLVYAPELAGFLHCLDAKTGQKVWEYDLKDSTWCSPLLADGRLLMGTDGDLLIFPAGRALKEPTKINMEAALKVPPVIASGTIYVNTGANLYAIAAK